MKKLMSLVMSGILSLTLLVGCEDKEDNVEDKQQIQQEEIIDKKEQTKKLVMNDLAYYEDVVTRMTNETEYLETIEQCETAYILINDILEELREYENCTETTELKGYLTNAIIVTMEGIDCIYQNDFYGEQEASTELDIYLDKFDQEYNKLINEYYINNNEIY